MNTVTTICVKTIYVLLSIVTLTDVGLFTYVTVSSHSRSVVSTPFTRNHASEMASSPPRGYSFEGTEAPVSAIATKGWVVRYSSAACKFSRSDQPRWEKLKTQMVAKGLHIYELFPDPTKQLPDAGGSNSETRLAFVDVSWMKNYRLVATPTTLVFDRNGKLIWSRMGTLYENDSKSALMAVLWNR